MESTKYKRKIAVFNAFLGGHNIEYLHHIYMNAINDYDIDFTFVVPDYFVIRKKSLEWPESPNIKFHYFKLDASEYLKICTSPLKKSWVLSRILKRTLKQTGLYEVVLIETIAFMPFLPFLTKSKTKITSIVYYIPKHHSYNTKAKQLYDKLLFFLMLKSNRFKRICLLNAIKDTHEYNKTYRTTIFSFLPDPYNPIEVTKSRDEIRKEFGIDSKDKLFIHFGSMTSRKGTIEILNAIALLDKEKLVGKRFLFAGKVADAIKEKFYNIIENIKDKANIIVYDKFCEYDFFGEICKAADYILIPYKNVSQSSGLCTYAAQFKTPVIGPSEGLLGEIIRDNGIGIAQEGLDAKKISEFIVDPTNADKNFSKEACDIYLKRSTPKEFYNSLIH